MQVERKNEKNRIKRTLSLFLEERKLCAGKRLVAGVDEAGRGALAGPVVAAAVILPENELIAGIDDSKKLSPGQRERLSEEIRRKAIAWAVSVVDVKYIDEYGIQHATLKAMQNAISRLNVQPQVVLVDAIEIPDLPFEQVAIIDGDARCYSIAAASILAKVERDRIMTDYHRFYPRYGFDRHKGYGTKQHMELIAAYGPSPVHRLSFRLPAPACD